jgi:hypothetical protein
VPRPWQSAEAKNDDSDNDDVRLDLFCVLFCSCVCRGVWIVAGRVVSFGHQWSVVLLCICEMCCGLINRSIKYTGYRSSLHCLPP